MEVDWKEGTLWDGFLYWPHKSRETKVLSDKCTLSSSAASRDSAKELETSNERTFTAIFFFVVVLFSLPESKFDCHCQKLKQEKNLLTFLLSKKKRAKREQKEGRHTNRVDKWFQKYCRPVTTDKRNKINCPILGPPAGLLFGWLFFALVPMSIFIFILQP